MEHVTDEVLRALRADRRIPAKAYAHVESCVRCRKSLGADVPPLPRDDRRKRALLIAACAALVLAMCAISPLRATALGFVRIFEPRQLAFIPMTADDLRGANRLPDFAEFGTSRELRHSSSIDVSDVRAAQSAAGYRLRLPQNLASRTGVTYTVWSPALEEFTFSEATARASARANNGPWQPMPPGMDGSIVRLALGSAVLATYGATPQEDLQERSHVRGARVFGSGNGRTPPSTTIVGQMPVPQIGSTGISMRAIEQYMIDRPGIPPRLAAAFAALRDPTTTLPLPIRIDERFARPVFVDGVWGTGIGDATGLGGVVVWERDGFVYGVGGTGTMDAIVATANALR